MTDPKSDSGFQFLYVVFYLVNQLPFMSGGQSCLLRQSPNIRRQLNASFSLKQVLRFSRLVLAVPPNGPVNAILQDRRMSAKT